jgi:integrase
MRSSRLKRHTAPPAPRKAQPWRIDHLRRFLAVAEQHPYAALWLLLALRGLRQGEARALVWADLDLDAGTARIDATLFYRNTAEWERTAPKTATSRRVVTLSPRMVALLRAHKARSAWCKPDDLVFVTPEGAPLSPAILGTWLTALCKRASVPRITPHTLRHLAASLLDEAGIVDSVRKEALGHASEQQTAHYTHIVDSRIAAAFRAVDELAETG